MRRRIPPTRVRVVSQAMKVKKVCTIGYGKAERRKEEDIGSTTKGKGDAPHRKQREECAKYWAPRTREKATTRNPLTFRFRCHSTHSATTVIT